MTGLLSLALATTTVVLLTYATAGSFRRARRPRPGLPFESGLVPRQHAVARHHVRWYAATIVFLAFDMEMVFMYPWAIVVADVGVSAVVEMFGFLAVLFVGVVYAWREGAFRWS